MNFPFVSIIFPNYNGKKDSLECLESLAKLNYPKDKLEIIVIDNGSNDGSQEEILKYFSEIKNLGFAGIKLIQNKKNMGAPAAYNQGIQQANQNFDYIWKLDNDVIVDKNSLAELVKFAEKDRKVGMASGKIYFGDCHRMVTVTAPIFWAIGGKINYFLGNFRNAAKNQIDKGQFQKSRKDFDFLPGCALLVKKEVIEKIGLLDEKYFIYYDEVDWCARAKNCGFQLAYVPKAVIWHKASKTTKEGSYFKNYYLTRNKILFFKKFKKSIFFPVLFCFLVDIPHRWLFRSKFSDLPNIVKGVGRGIRDGIKN